MNTNERRMKMPKKSLLFRFLYRIVSIFVPKYHFEIEEELDKESIVVGNHAQLHGPLAMQFRFPHDKKIWAISEVFKKNEFVDYAMKDFWPHKKHKRFYRFLAKMLAPLAEYIFKNADAIPVYRDHRLITTMRHSIQALQNHQTIIIFPEYHQSHSKIINDFLKNYIDLAKLYFQKHKQCLKFYPMYISPKLKKICIGKPYIFHPEIDFNQEKENITSYLQNYIEKMAYALPKHKVVPYENIPKKEYPNNDI